MPTLAQNRWVWIPQPNAKAILRLFCFPYAGGSAAIFRAWPRDLPPSVEVCAVQLPGHGSRLQETPFNRMGPLVSALEDGLLPLFDKPFAFFGHSMGAFVCFELARRLRKKHGIEPAHLFLSGAHAPHLPSREIPIHHLPEDEFIRALGGLNGTPVEVLEHPELMSLLVPVLRADFTVCETYSYKDGAALSCPITAFGGSEDRRLNRSELKAWALETNGPFTPHWLPGDHFFLNTSQGELLSLINSKLQPLVADAV